jgi:hypothetical protein
VCVFVSVRACVRACVCVSMHARVCVRFVYMCEGVGWWRQRNPLGNLDKATVVLI